MRYFKSQQIAFEHGDEEGAINRVYFIFFLKNLIFFSKECAIRLDGEVRDLQVCWLEEDMLKGMVEGLSMGTIVIQSVGAIRRQFGVSLTTMKIVFSVGIIMPCLLEWLA